MDNKSRYFSSLLTPGSVRAVLGKQAFRLPDCDPSKLGDWIYRTYEMPISQRYIDEWYNVFQIGKDPSDSRIPFMYYWPLAIRYFITVMLPPVGLGLRNIFHLGHESEIIERDFCTPGAEIALHARMTDIVPVKPNKLMLVNETELRNGRGDLLYRARDYTMCMNMKPHEIEALVSAGLGKDPLDFMKEGLRNRSSKFREPQKNEATYFCDNDLALRFGLTSGAINITHGVWLVSRYFKRGNPFLQGTCTANLIIMLLTMQKRERLNKYKVYFNNMLYLPGMVTLRSDNHDFELYDARGTMVSFGSRNS